MAQGRPGEVVVTTSKNVYRVRARRKTNGSFTPYVLNNTSQVVALNCQDYDFDSPSAAISSARGELIEIG